MVNIVFRSLTIKETSNSSSVSSGLNMVANRTSESKLNEGFGSISGKKNKVRTNKHVVFDRDMKDF